GPHDATPSRKTRGFSSFRDHAIGSAVVAIGAQMKSQMRSQTRTVLTSTRSVVGIAVGGFLCFTASCGSSGAAGTESTASVREALSAACADGTAEDVFANGMVGCAGKTTWASRASLCGAGYRPATAAEWTSAGALDGFIPTHDYWTNDDLRYSGTQSSCSASYSQGSPCAPGEPMRVCTAGGTDAEGNHCNWTKCGLRSTDNEYFGGCNGNATAG